MEKNDVKKIFARILLFAFIVFVSWYSTARRLANQNKEYGQIVKAIENRVFEDACDISVNIETEWPYGWSPTSMELSITKDGVTARTKTSKFFKPDRIRKFSGSFYYYFSRSKEGEKGKTIASFLELEMDDSKLKWIKVGECEQIDRSVFSSKDYKGCRNIKNTSIKCS